MGQAKDKLKRKADKAPVDVARLEAMATRLGRKSDVRKPVTWPGGEARIELRVLSVNETREAESAALVEAREQLGDDAVPRLQAAEAHGMARCKHILAHACMIPGEPARFFDSPAELGDMVTADELHTVFQLYEEHRQEVDPDLSQLSEEQLDAIDDAIKKKASTSLKSIASDLPRSSLLTLVDRLASSLTDSSTNT